MAGRGEKMAGRDLAPVAQDCRAPDGQAATRALQLLLAAASRPQHNRRKLTSQPLHPRQSPGLSFTQPLLLLLPHLPISIR